MLRKQSKIHRENIKIYQISYRDYSSRVLRSDIQSITKESKCILSLYTLVNLLDVGTGVYLNITVIIINNQTINNPDYYTYRGAVQ